ncbi:glycerol-3-phosphate acyltransferase 3 isoform X1 [Hetaerina americana]|uniref:glycerol-3-phosphate acyltransferase 3 isoform X1 n=1 Tax=Hetaerina americana TaxID=62018 RepID=UPI003A7F5A25
MALIATAVTLAFSILLTPFLLFLLAIIFLASIGKSLGVRRLYVKLLLKVFEYGRQHIERARRRERYEIGMDMSESEGEEIEGHGMTTNQTYSKSHLLNSMGDIVANGPYDRVLANNHSNSTRDGHKCSDGVTNLKLQNGHIPSGAHTVISREDLILEPDPECNHRPIHDMELNHNEQYSKMEDHKENAPAEKGEEKYPRRRSFETLKREFELADCLDYIKAGVEAIIEDEVTHRFEAEDLKSWNLLTRTNRRYEFISWKLTIIWMLGFCIRYFFLLPLRVMICFIGVLWTVVSATLIGQIPNCRLKRWLNARASLTSFRIFGRSLSVVLTFHNLQYRPKGNGICVANHTTPVDIVMLATENVFSLVTWLTLCTAFVGYFPEGQFKRWLNNRVSIMCFGILSSALSAVITYHNRENLPRGGICVANHTSPIDVLVLACDNCYALIGQRHGGFLGVLQRALARASSHIWFERSEVKDREAVTRRLREHVSDPNKPPILIFPEGTCINNTSVMQFKKGSFEVGGTIYPVAIKYDPKFGDAFWNSSKYSMIQYLYMMMTSWAIVCDVWYLPPMHQEPNESAIVFANRVKSVIARQGGLVDLMWDGQLKRMKPKKEWKEKQQEEFSKRLKIE